MCRIQRRGHAVWRNGDLCMSVQFRWCQRGNVHWRRLRKRSRMKHRTIYRKKYMCVGGDRHCLSIFGILEEKQKNIRSGYHFYDLFIIWDELLVFFVLDKVLGCYPWHMLDELLDLCHAVCRFMPDICWTYVLIFVFCLCHVFDSACWYSLDEYY